MNSGKGKEAECSDLDYAFQLQLEEALHLSTQTAKCKSIAIAEEDSVKRNADEMNILSKMQALELEKYHQPSSDMSKFSQEVRTRNHNAEFAQSILEMSKWEDDGDNFERAFEAENEFRPFMLYYKGLRIADYVGELWGAGVALYDGDGNLVMEIEKPLESGSEMAVLLWSIWL